MALLIMAAPHFLYDNILCNLAAALFCKRLHTGRDFAIGQHSMYIGGWLRGGSVRWPRRQSYIE